MEGASSSKLSWSQEELAEEAELIRLEILNAQQSLNKSEEITKNLLKTVNDEVKFVDEQKNLNREHEVVSQSSTLAQADCEFEYLKEVVVSKEKDLATYKELVQEIDIKNNVSMKEAKICELQILNDKEQERSSLNIERAQTNLAEIQQRIFKGEHNIRTYADSMNKHQTKRINELLETIDIQERIISKFMEEIAKLSQSIDYDTSRWDKEKMDLQNGCDIESAKIEILEIMLQEENQKLQNINYEIKASQQKKDFEASLKILKDEEESLEKELKEKRSQRSTKENDLLTIHQECERVKEQITNHERMMKFLSTLSALKKKEPVGASASVKTSPGLVPPPSKKPFFDQLSGSSADGHVLTMQEVKKLKEEQERRSRLRKLRKMQKAAENKTKK